MQPSVMPLKTIVMQHNEEKTNKYFAEAKLQGFTPEFMLRSSMLCKMVIQILGDMQIAEKEVADIIAWLCTQPEKESVVDRCDLRTLSAILLGMKDFNEIDCGHSEEILAKCGKN